MRINLKKNCADLTLSGDRFNERMIHRCYQRMLDTQDFGLRMHWWQRMAHYIKRRSPATVMDMEKARGL